MFVRILRSVRDFSLAGLPFAVLIIWVYSWVGVRGYSAWTEGDGKPVRLEYSAPGMPLTLFTRVWSESPATAPATEELPEWALPGLREQDHVRTMGTHLYLGNIAIVGTIAIALSALGVWAWWRLYGRFTPPSSGDLPGAPS
jgi:hypothetical protein